VQVKASRWRSGKSLCREVLLGCSPPLPHRGLSLNDPSPRMSAGLRRCWETEEEDMEEAARTALAYSRSSSSSSTTASDKDSRTVSQCSSSSSSLTSAAPDKTALPADSLGSMVVLHVYDVTNFNAVKALNRAILPLGGGGAFHVGVEVWQKEYSYGFRSVGTGVTKVSPCGDPGHQFQGSVELGHTYLSQGAVTKLVSEMAVQWQGCDYHMIRHNCMHFAAALVEKLGAGPLPAWVDRLPRAAEQLLRMQAEAFQSQIGSTVGGMFEVQPERSKDRVLTPDSQQAVVM